MTVASGTCTVVLNIPVIMRAFPDGLIKNDEKVASYKDVDYSAQKPYYIHDQNSQKRYPIYYQNGLKTILFGAAYSWVQKATNVSNPQRFL